jgi:hypothetical protein
MSTPPESLGVSLNANQRRHYGILIAGLEATLAKVEAALTVTAEARGLTRVVSDLPPAFQTGAPPILARVRAALQHVTQGLALEIHPVSQRQTCRALLTSEINRLEESYSTQLRGYGAVDASVGTTLDPLLREVRADLGSLVAMLAKPHA